jgi:hypothetical protein
MLNYSRNMWPIDRQPNSFYVLLCTGHYRMIDTIG